MEVVAKKMDGFSKDVTWKPWPTAMGQSMFTLVSRNLLCSTEELADRVGGNTKASKFLDALPRLQRIINEVAEDSKKDDRPNDLRVTELIRKLARRYFGRQDVSTMSALTSLNLSDNSAGLAAEDTRSRLFTSRTMALKSPRA